MIDERECDRLEDLWDERENIMTHTDDNGNYSDDVTKILKEAALFAYSYHEERIDEAEQTIRTYKAESEDRND